MEQEIQGLLNNLKSDDWWKRKESIESLLLYPEDTYLYILERWLRNDEDALIRNASMEAYRALGQKAVSSLVPLLKDDDKDIRLFAANLLGDLRASSAINQLVDALTDLDDNVRIASAEALGKIGDRKVLPALTKALDDEQWIAIAAIQAIGEIGGEDALQILYACLEREDYQGFAISAIQNAGTRESLTFLTPFVENSEHLFNRELALEAIVTIADRERVRLKPDTLSSVTPALIDMLKSQNAELRKPAFIALCWSEDVIGLPYFIEAVKDEELTEYAIDGILSIGRKAAPALVEALKDSTGDHRSLLAKVLSMIGEGCALLHFRKDEDPQVRREVAQALGAVNSPTSVRALLKMLSDPFEEVRLAARQSLEDLKKTK